MRTNSQSKTKTGKLQLSVDEKKGHVIWTKRIGSGSLKVLMLHGGPSFSHEYLEAFESFLPEAGIEMIYYDQLGSNNSDRPDDLSLWSISRFVEEVEEVRLGLRS